MNLKVYWKLEAVGKLKEEKACAAMDVASEVEATLKKDGWTVTEISKADYDKIGG